MLGPWQALGYRSVVKYRQFGKFAGGAICRLLSVAVVSTAVLSMCRHSMWTSVYCRSTNAEWSSMVWRERFVSSQRAANVSVVEFDSCYMVFFRKIDVRLSCNYATSFGSRFCLVGQWCWHFTCFIFLQKKAKLSEEDEDDDEDDEDDDEYVLFWWYILKHTVNCFRVGTVGHNCRECATLLAAKLELPRVYLSTLLKYVLLAYKT